MSTFYLRRIVGTTEHLVFCRAKNSILFYLGRNTRNLTPVEVIEFFDATDDAYVIISQKMLDDMPEHPGFEFVQLAKYVCIGKNRTFLLLGKKDIDKKDVLMPSDGT